MRKLHKIQMTRRQVMTMSCAAGALSFMRNPVEMALRSLVDGIITKAQADEGSSSLPKNYLFMYIPAGQPRWTFDLLLKTSKSDPKFMTNAQVNTRFDMSSGAPVPVYDTVTYGGYEFPTLWSSMIPTSSGMTVPMSSLLSNLLSIRGINMLTDGHPTNAARHLQPNPSSPSLDGLVADASNRPIPVIGDNSIEPFSTGCYQSSTGIGQGLFNTQQANPLSVLLSPFDKSGDAVPPSFVNRRQALDQAIQRGLASLKGFAESSQPGASSLYAMRDSAEQILAKGVGDLSSSFNGLQAKYQKLISACTGLARPGVTDAAVATQALANPAAMAQFNNAGTVAKNADLRSLIQASTSVYNMAAGFAVAEYMIIQGYSSAVTTGFGGAHGVVTDNLGAVDWSTDEHTTGSATSLVVNSFVYQALAACLYELVGQLKAAGAWQNTVVHLGGEFSRSPRNSADGSDHGIPANVTTLLSGAIQGPLVLGNTTAVASGTYAGSWGVSAPVQGFDGGATTLLIGHSASTAAALLGVASPTANDSPVITVDAATDRVIPLIGMENV